jgi:hypothetical protein
VCQADVSSPTNAEVRTDWSSVSKLLCAFRGYTWKNLLYMDDGYVDNDDDVKRWAGKKMDHSC